MMINQFTDHNFNLYWSSVPVNQRGRFYDYDQPLAPEPIDYKVDSQYGPFHVYENGNGDLIVEIDSDEREDFARVVADEATRGYCYAEREIFEPIWTNGLDFFNLDEIGALSEAPAFGDFAHTPDWITDIRREAANWRARRSGMGSPVESDWTFEVDWGGSRFWSAIEYYQIESPLDVIARTGKAVFRLAR